MKRSSFFQQIGIGAFSATILQKPVLAGIIATGNMFDHLYVGTYTDTPEGGIPVCSFDSQNGAVQLIEVCQGVNNPSFLIFGRNRKFVYAAIETDDFGGKKAGAVSAFRRDEKTGKLTFLNSVTSLGAHPCHLTIDRTGRFILVANYTGGNAAVLPVMADGSLGEPVDSVQHSGKGPNTSRQEVAHVHSVNLSPDNRFAFVCDLGIDKIMIYRFDEKTGKLSPSDIPYFQTAPGAGPRHFTFSRDGQNAFVVNELNSTITAMTYDPAKGVLSEIQTLTTLPEAFTGENTCADIHVHPNGHFLYASNRGHDSIALYSVEPGGRMKLVQHQPTLGKTPRNFAIHSSGRFLLAANQTSGSIQVFSLDPGTGRLNAAGKSISINKPVCLLF